MLPFVVRLRLLLPVCITLSLATQAQYQRVADTITLPHQKIVINKTGFPLQVFNYYNNDPVLNSMLTEPVHFHISDSTTRKDIPFISQGVTYSEKGKTLQWHAVNTAAHLQMTVDGSLQKKNQLVFTVALTALKNLSLADIKLHLPFVIEQQQYTSGLGRNGALSDTIQWKWNNGNGKDKDADFSVNAGKGNLLVLLKSQPSVPASWGNHTKGGLWIGIKGKSLLAEANNGSLVMNAGEVRHYNFTLQLRPSVN